MAIRKKMRMSLRVQFAADAALEIVLGTLPESVMDTLDLVVMKSGVFRVICRKCF